MLCSVCNAHLLLWNKSRTTPLNVFLIPATSGCHSQAGRGLGGPNLKIGTGPRGETCIYQTFVLYGNNPFNQRIGAIEECILYRIIGNSLDYIPVQSNAGNMLTCKQRPVQMMTGLHLLFTKISMQILSKC